MRGDRRGYTVKPAPEALKNARTLGKQLVRAEITANFQTYLDGNGHRNTGGNRDNTLADGLVVQGCTLLFGNDSDSGSDAGHHSEEGGRRGHVENLRR